MALGSARITEGLAGLGFDLRDVRRTRQAASYILGLTSLTDPPTSLADIAHGAFGTIDQQYHNLQHLMRDALWEPRKFTRNVARALSEHAVIEQLTVLAVPAPESIAMFDQSPDDAVVVALFVHVDSVLVLLDAELAAEFNVGDVALDLLTRAQVCLPRTEVLVGRTAGVALPSLRSAPVMMEARQAEDLWVADGALRALHRGIEGIAQLDTDTWVFPCGQPPLATADGRRLSGWYLKEPGRVPLKMLLHESRSGSLETFNWSDEIPLERAGQAIDSLAAAEAALDRIEPWLSQPVWNHVHSWRRHVRLVSLSTILGLPGAGFDGLPMDA